MSTTTTAEQLSIGAIADQSGVSVSTVRYYDEIGIISATSRVGGKRRFSPDAVGRICFIRRAQEAGFSLEETRTILDDTAGDWLDVVDTKQAELEERRTRLDVMISLLDEIRRCGCDAVADCPRSPC